MNTFDYDCGGVLLSNNSTSEPYTVTGSINIGTISYDFGVYIDGNKSSAEDVYEKVQGELRRDDDVMDDTYTDHPKENKMILILTKEHLKEHARLKELKDLKWTDLGRNYNHRDYDAIVLFNEDLYKIIHRNPTSKITEDDVVKAINQYKRKHYIETLPREEILQNSKNILKRMT